MAKSQRFWGKGDQARADAEYRRKYGEPTRESRARERIRKAAERFAELASGGLAVMSEWGEIVEAAYGDNDNAPPSTVVEFIEQAVADIEDRADNGVEPGRYTPPAPYPIGNNDIPF